MTVDFMMVYSKSDFIVYHVANDPLLGIHCLDSFLLGLLCKSLECGSNEILLMTF